MAHDVFIAYSFDDQEIVDEITKYLEDNGISCFVANRDIAPGKEWADYIPPAIKNCKIMVYVHSEKADESINTNKEIALCSKYKHPILPFKISDTKYTGAKEYHLETINWIDAFPNPKDYFGKLLTNIKQEVEKIRQEREKHLQEENERLKEKIERLEKDRQVNDATKVEREENEKAAQKAKIERETEERAAEIAKEKREAEERAAKEAKEKREAEENAAENAKTKRLAEEKAYEEAKKKREKEEKPVEVVKEKSPEKVTASKESNFTEPQFGIEMAYVEGGTFKMGATPEQGSDCYSDEKPAHQVAVSSFYIGKYQVTQAQWKAVMGSNPSNFKGDSLPVEQVSWDDVQEFIRKLNAQTGKQYRLPTEAEWEFAARGGIKSNGYKYSGSNSVDNVAWYTGNSEGKTHDAGKKQANELGLYDMSGNVREWCSDWYNEDYYKTSPTANPTGPNTGSSRVLRGGSWYNYAQYCRVSHRGSSTPDDRGDRIGFRLVLVP